jgi:hypothetical protein
MKEKTNDTILGIFFVLLGLFILYRVFFVFEKVSAKQFYRSPSFFPIVVGATLILLSTILLLRTRVSTKKNRINGTNPEEERLVETGKVAPEAKRKSIGVIVAVIAYTALLRYGGFLFLTPPLVAVLLWLFEVKKVYTIIIFSVVVTGVLFYVFQEVLDVILPRGVILRLLF